MEYVHVLSDHSLDHSRSRKSGARLSGVRGHLYAPTCELYTSTNRL